MKIQSTPARRPAPAASGPFFWTFSGILRLIGSNGINFGILAAGGLPTHPKLNDTEPLIQNAVDIRLTGLDDDFDLTYIGDVLFNYGTDFNPIPAPGAALLAMIGIVMTQRVRRNRS